jgi:hypothetical protein
MNKFTAQDLGAIVAALANEADRAEREGRSLCACACRHALFKAQAQRDAVERREKRAAKKAAAALDDFNYVGSRHHY